MRPVTALLSAMAVAAAPACSSPDLPGDPLVSPNKVTAVLDGRPWTSTSVSTASFVEYGGVFKLIVTNPGDSVATQVKLILVHIPFGPGTYQVIDTTGTEEVLPRAGYMWGTSTASDGCSADCFITFPSWGTITFTRLDADRAIGSFSINPLPHHTAGTFDVSLH